MNLTKRRDRRVFTFALYRHRFIGAENLQLILKHAQ